MSLLLDNINKENRPTYLMGDYNIDLLKSNTTHRPTQLFLNQMLSSGFFPAIDRATRITDTSATLIDNIYTNVHHKGIKSYIWITDISDHLPVCATIPGKKIGHKLGPSHAMKRIYTENNMHIILKLNYQRPTGPMFLRPHAPALNIHISLISLIHFIINVFH